MDLVSLLTSTTSKGNPNAWDISKAYYDAGADAWDLSKAFSPNVSYTYSDQEDLGSALFFKPDGTKMYICGRRGDDVNEYTLSTPWLVSSATYVQAFSISAQESFPTGLFFKPDGTKMYVIGSNGDDVNEYNLSSAWDVSTASYVQNFSVATEELTPEGVFFKPDGTKMYVVGATGDDVNEYDLSTPWDVSTASYLQNFSVSAQDTAPSGLFFKSDGTKMYVAGGTGNDVNEYSLSSAWDVSTASFVTNFALGFEPNNIFFDPEGSYFYVDGGTFVRQYTIGGFNVATEETGSVGLFFKPDGTKMYICGVSGDDVNEYDLSSAWVVSSATYLQNFSVASQDTSPYGLVFKPDGTEMYVLGRTGNDVNKYALSTPWDVSTASFVTNYGLTMSGTTFRGFYISPDGLNLYAIRTTVDDMYFRQFVMSSAWDLSTLSGSTTVNLLFNNTPAVSTPEHIFFKTDGTKYYLLNDVTRPEIYEYSVSTPWDVLTRSYVATYIIAGSSSSNLFWRDDGARFWVLEGTRVLQYSISPL